MSYNNGCGAVSTIVTVNTAPVAFTGSLSVCSGSTTPLGESSVGGIWSSTSTTVASVNATGHVSGLTYGLTTISYTNNCGTYSAVVTVNVPPGPINGSTLACSGVGDSLTDTVAYGSWTFSTSFATVAAGGDSTGVISGLSCGTGNVTYSTGCAPAAWMAMTISAAPSSSAITGNTPVCISGSALTLNITACSGPGAAAWPVPRLLLPAASLHPALLPVATVTYTTACGYTTTTVSVNGTPAAITGNIPICIGSCITLSDSTVGGTWYASGTSGHVTVASGTGIVCGSTQGTQTVAYTNGCGTSTTVVTVNNIPAPISGPGVVCVGATITMGDVSTGGNWYSGDTSIATVDSVLGVVTGVLSGSTVITYTNSCGTPSTKTITVDAPPGPITGTMFTCIGKPRHPFGYHSWCILVQLLHQS